MGRKKQMTRIRVLVVVLLVWVLSFYLADWLTPQLTFTPAAKLFLPLTAVALLAVPRLLQVPLNFLLGALVAGLLITKWATGAPLLGSALPVTIIEAGAVAVTAVLTRQVSLSIRAFEEAVLHITMGQIGERRARYGEVYREVRRARAYHRPLSVLAVRYERNSMKVAENRALLEAQEAMAKHYLLASLGRVLNESLDDYNIVARRDDYFLVVLPETPAEEVGETIQHLRQAGLDQAGAALHIGAACLPDDATTWDGLVEKATEEMQSDEALLPGPVPENPDNADGHFMVDETPLAEVNKNGHMDR